MNLRFLVMIELDRSVIVSAEEALVDLEHHVVNFVSAEENGRLQTIAQWNIGKIIGWTQLDNP